MYDFQYERAGSVEDALTKLRAAEDGLIVAGGMTLIPTMKQRLTQPSHVIDLGGIADLRGIAVSRDRVTIGAMTKHDTVARSTEVKQALPVPAEMASVIGDPAVRNRGTLGGSICNNDPAADYPAALLALGATVHTDRRTIVADD